MAATTEAVPQQAQLQPEPNGIAPILIPQTPSSSHVDQEALTLSAKIIDIISRYRLNTPRNASARVDEGNFKFLSVIYGHVKASREIPLCLPAFPFKSPNATRKVLGKLPDKAEEFALAHLNGLCLAIKDLYEPGARLTIISDGLVYNDLLGVPDRDVWAYGTALRKLSEGKGFDRIAFSRLRDLVSLSLPEQLDEMTYVANASNFRRALLNTFTSPNWQWEDVKQNEDTCLTYRGYIKFLETDLEYVYPQGENRSKSKYKRGVEYIAKQMLARGDAFANAVNQKYGSHVRLSIHASTGASKLSVGLLPTDSTYTTPWHCTIAFMLDGTLKSGMRSEFEADQSLELVYENDRPSYFRERSELLTWGSNDGVVCEPLYPSGMQIVPHTPGSLGMADIDAPKVRALAEINSPVVLRGFCKQQVNRDAYLAKAKEFGEPLPWKFGLVLEVKDRGSETGGLNNVLSAEWMPFHFDGLFKTTKKTNDSGKELLVPVPPRFQFFAGVTQSPKDTGFTVFSSSTLLFKHLPSWLTADMLSSMTWSVSTSSFDQTKMDQLQLVVPHPTTNKPCLRWHEPWPQSKTLFDATDVAIDGQGTSTSDAINAEIGQTLHDRRVAYYHAWEKGDLVVSDNILMMHTRSDFKAGCDRELWRIHFD